MAKYLVSGGAGFIGSNIVDELMKRGNQVRVLDDISTGKKENLAQHGSKVELIQGSITDKAAAKKAVQGMDFVLHLAAVRAVLRSVDNPEETNTVNVGGVLNMLTAAKEAGVKRFVFTSSSSIYGDTDKFPLGENETPNPLSPYAASKIMGEYYAKIFSKLYGMETVSLRYFNVFGPRQNPESIYSAVIPIFIDCLLKGISPEIHWDGKQSRDFTYVDNVVLGNILAAETPGVSGEVFNIACQEEYSVLDIFNNLKEILKINNVEPTFKPKRAGDVRRTFADISKSVKMLNFKPQTRFRPGLEKTVKWFLDSGILTGKK
jgi:nucleoside-diphosphate-sugar epimerase